MKKKEKNYFWGDMKDNAPKTTMKKIKLTKGLFAKVDKGDFEWLNKMKWHADKKGNTSYAVNTETVNGKSKNIGMHRFIMGIAPGVEIDHINGDGLDNRRKNLRFCTRDENMENFRKPRNNKSGYKGVVKKKSTGKWVAQIMEHGRQHHIGTFQNKEDAARAYNEAALKYHGEFARLNQIKKTKAVGVTAESTASSRNTGNPRSSSAPQAKSWEKEFDERFGRKIAAFYFNYDSPEKTGEIWSWIKSKLHSNREEVKKEMLEKIEKLDILLPQESLEEYISKVEVKSIIEKV